MCDNEVVNGETKGGGCACFMLPITASSTIFDEINLTDRCPIL